MRQRGLRPRATGIPARNRRHARATWRPGRARVHRAARVVIPAPHDCAPAVAGTTRTRCARSFKRTLHASRRDISKRPHVLLPQKAPSVSVRARSAEKMAHQNAKNRPRASAGRRLLSARVACGESRHETPASPTRHHRGRKPGVDRFRRALVAHRSALTAAGELSCHGRDSKSAAKCCAVVGDRLSPACFWQSRLTA